jgi:hypothetical protein
LIASGDHSLAVVAALEQELRVPRHRVGRVLVESADPPDPAAVEAQLRGHAVLDDIEILFTPQLRLDPLALLRRLARASPPVIARWPGRLNDGRATYSVPARDDHYDRPLENLVILRPTAPAFPGEPSFDVERWT